MINASHADIDAFITDLASRYAAYAKNRMWDEGLGQEVIIPVRENSLVRESLQQAIDELCASYLTVSDEEREHIRKLVEPHRSLHQGLIDHIHWACQRINSPDHIEWVLHALASASIENNWLDYRDMFTALGALYLAAVNAGIDTVSCFREVGKLSSSKVNPGARSSMQNFLANFDGSEYFKQSIRPKLLPK